MTAPKIVVQEDVTILIDGKIAGYLNCYGAGETLCAALAELEALRPAPPEPVLVTQIKGRTIDGETEPVAQWSIDDDVEDDCWYEVDGTCHNLTVDPATATVLCRPLDADA